MFYGCESLTNLDISNFNTQNVTNFNHMFDECYLLEKQNVITKDKNLIIIYLK